MGDYEIRTLTSETWPAYAALIEKHHGIFGGCWDTYFHSLERDPDRTYDSNRELKCRLVEEGRAHAAVVFDGDAAVGWCQYGSPGRAAEHPPPQAVPRGGRPAPRLPAHVHLRRP